MVDFLPQAGSLHARFRLDGRVAVVTGASSGLGAASALALADAGAKVVVAARREDRLTEVVGRVRAIGGEALAVRADVTSIDDCAAVAAAAMDAFGRLDILVNNAGVGGQYHPATEDPPEHFMAVVNVNLFGSYWMAQACGRVMGPGSSVVNFSSVLAVTTAKMPAAAYSASKAGILGLTRDLAAQWGVKGIRVNAILPGVFPTEATANYGENYKRKVIDARIPIGRLGEPYEIASVVVFLASDASSYVTGVSLPVDGGVLLL